MPKGTTTRSPRFRFGDLRADLLHDAHRLVTEDVALVHEHAQHLVEMQVGAADGCRGDPHYGVVGRFDAGIRNAVDADVAPTMPGDSFHDSDATSPVSRAVDVNRLAF